jgi:hypothetical protein
MARVAAAVSEIDEHMKNHVLGRAEARRIKTATREAVFAFLKTIAQAARRVTQAEPGVSPFRMPRRRSLAAELATARAFIEEAAARQAEFERFGLPVTFITDFRTLVDELQQAADVRISSKTVRRKAVAGITTAVAQGLEAARDLDVFVSIATRQDPTTFAAWTSARRIEGLGSSAVKPPVAPPVPQPTAPPMPPVLPIGQLEKAS